MKKKFFVVISFAMILTIAFTSLALAAQPAHVIFTADAPCPVTVLVIGYTDPANISAKTASGSTPWQLDVYPSTSVTFFYRASVVCNGTTYNYVSASPNSPLTSGAEGDTTTVTGHYALPDTTPPVWTVPADFSVEATSSSGAVVTYTASASDPDDDVSSQSCSPASGATFALGTMTVNCTATDTHNNTGIASFNVTVVDTTPPVLALPANMTDNALNTSGAAVSFSASANDLVDGPVVVICSPASGSLFPFGTTTVNCFATDSHNNAGTGSFTVTVVDTNSPTLSLPADMTVNALNASGAVVKFTASANDLVDGPVAVTCLPASGSLFPLGTTIVNCSATDSHGNNVSGNFNVTVVMVVDMTPPVLTLPADIIVEALNASGAVVNFTASANDLVDGSVAVTCSPASGSLFPRGTTTVNCSATDSQGNTGMGSFNVTVVDTTPPALTLPADMTVIALNASGAPVSFVASANDLVDGPVAMICSPSSGSLFPIRLTTVNCSAADSHGNHASGSFNVAVQYATAGNNCRGVLGHQILQPINTDGSSVFNAGRTVPAKFRVCGADGISIGTDGVVSSFRLVQIISDGRVSNVDEVVASTSSDTEFRSGNQQWIFNINTRDLIAGNTYVYLITLNDGSAIQFQFTLN